jgi:two-component system OmpR family response regulator
MDHVWSYDFRGDGNVVETYISYLRRRSIASTRR